MIKPLKQPLVLMYHGIVSEWSAVPKERETGAELYDVTVCEFQKQMQWLKDNKRPVEITEGDVSPEGNRRVILTFDDGELNNYESALPVLKKYYFPAYFFIIAKRVGCARYMGWDELRAMHEAGMVIGSHGFSHEILTNLQDSQIEEELRASKKYLERNLNIVIDSLSIPRGFCDDRIIRMAREAGYKTIFISERPRALRGLCFSRVAVKSHWSLTRFSQALNGHVPLGERVMGQFKAGIKRIFGGSIYDWLRRVLLGIK